MTNPYEIEELDAPTTPPTRTIIIPVSPSSSSFLYSASVGKDVSDALLDQCARLFSTNYGVWGEKALSISKYTQPGSFLWRICQVAESYSHYFFFPGQPVKMSGRRLKSQCLSIPESTVLVTCFKDEDLVGHAFATVWNFEGGLLYDQFTSIIHY